MSQADKNGVTVYNYNGSEIPADNVTYPVPDDQNLRNSTFRAWCEGDMLKGNIVGKYYDNGAEFGDLDMVLSLSLDGNNLKNVTTGNLKGKDGNVYPINADVTCTRN